MISPSAAVSSRFRIGVRLYTSLPNLALSCLPQRKAPTLDLRLLDQPLLRLHYIVDHFDEDTALQYSPLLGADVVVQSELLDVALIREVREIRHELAEVLARDIARHVVAQGDVVEARLDGLRVGSIQQVLEVVGASAFVRRSPPCVV